MTSDDCIVSYKLNSYLIDPTRMTVAEKVQRQVRGRKERA